jgi:hypothetical protein
MAYRKRIPSARVIAAQWVLRQLDENVQSSSELSAAAFAELAKSRVNEKKADKVRKQIDKLIGRLLGRLDNILDRFENPSPRKGKSVPPKHKAKKE